MEQKRRNEYADVTFELRSLFAVPHELRSARAGEQDHRTPQVLCGVQEKEEEGGRSFPALPPLLAPPASGNLDIVPQAPCLALLVRCLPRCLVRQRIHVHASVLEALGFPGALQEGGPRLLGRFSSCVLASPEDYKKIGFLFSVHSLVRRWSGVQEMTSQKTFVFSTLVGPTADSRTASVYGGFQEVHTFSTCRWTLDPEVSELPDEYKKMCFLWETSSGKCFFSALLVRQCYLFASVWCRISHFPRDGGLHAALLRCDHHANDLFQTGLEPDT